MAYDVFLHATRDLSPLKRWRIRRWAMFLTTLLFTRTVRETTFMLLKQDGIVGWRARLGLFRWLWLKPGLYRRMIGDYLAFYADGEPVKKISSFTTMDLSGRWSINGRDLETYFPNRVHQQIVNEPFVTLGQEGRYDVIARMSGGGVSGQAGALRLGIARALNEIDEEGNRPPLKKAGFLTRDPRAKERKKYGLKKARKAPQYSKR